MPTAIGSGGVTFGTSGVRFGVSETYPAYQYRAETYAHLSRAAALGITNVDAAFIDSYYAAKETGGWNVAAYTPLKAGYSVNGSNQITRILSLEGVGGDLRGGGIGSFTGGTVSTATGQALLTFNGTNQCLESLTNSTYDMGTQDMLMFLPCQPGTKAIQAFVAKGMSGSTYGRQSLYSTSTTTLSVQLQQMPEDGTGLKTVTAANGLVSGTTKQTLASFALRTGGTGTNGALQLWRDGVQQGATTDIQPGTNFVTAQALRVAAYENGNSLGSIFSNRIGSFTCPGGGLYLRAKPANIAAVWSFLAASW